MMIEEADVVRHEPVRGDYRMLVLRTGPIAAAARPGQFVHLKVPEAAGATLRRPFSIHNAEDDSLYLLYKEVGRGTRAMAALGKGDRVSVMGPLGNGFPSPDAAVYPLLVAGGYGVAPLFFLARRLPQPGVLFAGAATEGDLLLIDAFRALHWDVQVTTVDGSAGRRGLVTEAVLAWLLDWRHGADGGMAAGRRCPVFYACGPEGLLRALDKLAAEQGLDAWVSLDKRMGCGTGACLACVQKVRGPAGAEWARVCRDGPVFNARDVIWE